MDQKQLQKRNDLLSQISALKASIAGLKLTGNKDYEDLIKGNEDALKIVEDEFKLFEDEVHRLKDEEIKRRQEAKQKEMIDEFKLLNKFFTHLGKLKLEDVPNDDLIRQFKIIKRKPHVLRRLKQLGF